MGCTHLLAGQALHIMCYTYDEMTSMQMGECAQTGDKDTATLNQKFQIMALERLLGLLIHERAFRDTSSYSNPCSQAVTMFAFDNTYR